MLNEVTDEFIAKQDEKGGMVCIDCGASDQWQEGPSGGACVNIQCANCGARFNVGPGFIERISLNAELRAEWETR